MTTDGRRFLGRVHAVPRLGAIAAAAALLASCGPESLEAEVSEALSAEPTYALHIAPLLERHCVACHDGHGPRSGGVELDRFISAYSNRYRNACVSVSEDLAEQFAEALTPSYLPPRFDDRDDPDACEELDVFSMPPGAKSKMTPYEQVLLIRWIEIGTPE